MMTDEHGSTDGDAQRGSDRARAAENDDATWSSGDDDVAAGSSGPLLGGVLSGDVGPKGRIGARHRSLSRTERATYGDVPFGTTTPGSGRYLVVMLAVAAGLAIAGALLLVWALS